jgi:adenylyl-sulfate kinase
LQEEIKETNITWQQGKVGTKDYEKLLGQRGCVVWLTGLPASGKSTIAHMLEERLVRQGNLAYVLDGDNIRHGLNGDLGFSAEDRSENIRRVGEVAALFARAGVITIVAFISPYIAGRQGARKAAGDDRFVEVYVDTPLDECEKRDPKGLYQKARGGEIAEFTGIDAPYEPPENPEIVLRTHEISCTECVEVIWKELCNRGVFHKTGGQVKSKKK